ncbi:hypothetical protein Avbf_11735 [Armadillidium vulgare]|nr:hypothetical protein Avbf_11735 [Armadillidium vulgare]
MKNYNQTNVKTAETKYNNLTCIVHIITSANHSLIYLKEPQSLDFYLTEPLRIPKHIFKNSYQRHTDICDVKYEDEEDTEFVVTGILNNIKFLIIDIDADALFKYINKKKLKENKSTKSNAVLHLNINIGTYMSCYRKVSEVVEKKIGNNGYFHLTTVDCIV